MILYTALVHAAIGDMARVVPALRHIDARRLAVAAAPRVSTKRYGNLAQCYALREAETEDLSYWYHAKTRQVVRATPWYRYENTRLSIGGVEMLYLILLRLPRLLEHDPILTIVHELIHVGPDFDGRLRRLRHGKRFDLLTHSCAGVWRREGRPDLVQALEMDFGALARRWGSLIGLSFAHPFVSPRLRPLPDAPPIESHPDFHRKRLVCDPARLRIVQPKWTGPTAPACLSERELVYRLYTPDSARRISRAAVGAAQLPFSIS